MLIGVLAFGLTSACGDKSKPGTVLPDASLGDLVDSVDSDDSGDIEADTPDDGSVEPDTVVDVPKFFEQPCSGNEDCVDEFETGWCVEIDEEGNRQCTYSCIQDCPPGYSCVFIEVGGSDQVAVCMPEIDTACDPCESDFDCVFSGAQCHEIGFQDGEPELRCAYDCADTGGQCDEGYECKVFPSPEGPQSLCIPKTNSCVCFGQDGEGDDINGSEQTCTSGDGLGACTGTTTCDGENGWTPCTAQEAVPETCDGVDNDCNGDIDDGLGQTTCGKGGCGHTIENCLDGTAQTCDPFKGVTDEICDGIDNDCDASVDEGCVPTELTLSFVSAVVQTPTEQLLADGVQVMMSVGLPGVQGSSMSELPGGVSVRWGYYFVIP